MTKFTRRALRFGGRTPRPPALLRRRQPRLHGRLILADRTPTTRPADPGSGAVGWRIRRVILSRVGKRIVEKTPPRKRG